MLCILHVYLMLFTASINVVCLYNANWFVIDLWKCFLFSCFLFGYWHNFNNYFASCSVLLIRWYVTDMLHKNPLHTSNTRSSSYTMPLLNRPAHSMATLGDRSFPFASSSVWNSVPNDVRCAPSLSSFKSRLKTYLFRSVYKDWIVSLITVHMCMVWHCYCFVDGLS